MGQACLSVSPQTTSSFSLASAHKFCVCCDPLTVPFGGLVGWRRQEDMLFIFSDSLQGTVFSISSNMK